MVANTSSEAEARTRTRTKGEGSPAVAQGAEAASWQVPRNRAGGHLRARTVFQVNELVGMIVVQSRVPAAHRRALGVDARVVIDRQDRQFLKEDRFGPVKQLKALDWIPGARGFLD